MASKPPAKPSAKAPAPMKGGKDTAKSVRKTSKSLRFAYFIIMILAGLFFPTTVLFSGGLLPTLIAAIVDNRPQKTAWLTVGSLNFAGIVPAWFDLWKHDHTLKAAFEILSDPRTIIFAYVAAGAGWVVYFQVPRIVTALMIRKAEIRLRDIEKRKKELIRKWGNEVGAEIMAQIQAATPPQAAAQQKK